MCAYEDNNLESPPTAGDVPLLPPRADGTPAQTAARPLGENTVPSHTSVVPLERRLRRSYLQFSLRGLLVAVAVVSLLLAPVAKKFAFFRRQQAAIAQLAKDEVEDDYAQVDTEYEKVEPAWFWSRVESMTGVKCQHVKSLRVSGSFSDADRRGIMACTSVRELWLEAIPASDDLLFELRELPELRVVGLGSSSYTDNGLRALAACRTLEWVRFGRNGDITDVGIAALAELPKLTKLDVRKCRLVTMDGLVPILDKGRLRSIGVPSDGDLNTLSDRGLRGDLRELLRCPSLEEVSIYNPSPEQIRILGELPNLAFLTIEGQLTLRHEAEILAIRNLVKLRGGAGYPNEGTLESRGLSDRIAERLSYAISRRAMTRRSP